MAGFLRGKQAGIQNDLSAGIVSGLFSPDDRARFGINSQIGCLAYDPIQSLLAVGTNESPFGSGQIYIYGQGRVQATLQLPRRASVKELQFVADRIISLDSKNELIIWDLASAKKVTSFNPPGVVTTMVTDPMLDWALLGLQNGDVICYDLASEKIAPLRLPNFWKERSPKSRLLPVVSMQLHPRDIGQLLIGYTEGVVIYSFKQAKPIRYFEYTVPAGAPGGNTDSQSIGTVRKPKLTQVLWHPTGTFVAGAFDDESLVFWDSKDGRVVMARTLTDTNVDKPGNVSKDPGAFNFKEPFVKIAWCCRENPDDTGILIAGGSSKISPQKGLTFMELGQTPVYATSSWQVLSDHFEAKKQHFLPTPLGAEVVNFCLIPRTSPHFAGNQDPIAIIAVLTSGELITLSFPSGYPISPTNMLPPSLTFVHPFVTTIAVAPLDRGRWLGMVESRQRGTRILKGGAESVKSLRKKESRNIVLMAHGDGTVRIWDAGHGDELENSTTCQVDLARSLNRYEDINITMMSMGLQTGELAVGTSRGEVVLYRWGGNKRVGQELSQDLDVVSGGLTDISIRAEPALKEGLQPYVLYDLAQGPIHALGVSDMGFVGVGSEGGVFSLIDMRDAKGAYTAQFAGVTSLDGKIVSISPIVSSTGNRAAATGATVGSLRDGIQTHGTLVVGSSIVTPSGCVFGWTGPSELAMLNVWGTGEPLPKSHDHLFNPKVTIPPRPTISNMQWISGTQYVSPIDLDLLIGGPDRPPSKRMMALAAEEDRLARSGGSSRAGTAPAQEGWGDYMTRQLNERTERLNIIGDSTDQMLENSQGWAEDVNKFLSKLA
ncbi:putative Lethal(2) giant larvae protein like protein SRO77 [Glarea lozoyensis 74030]|uniref:Putative Lethal(2) giant larvae protein like protein SRO77 n=1 Tax=Glarea lozoyensis (strain ATCC 74030 / MF5533) TaxID=1104152 RepID=H0EP27_GLAL7|nr:putative Lethal(2) giant larvae protein like protein SRO77 [Glarea lozoyensis 74030]